MEGFGVEGLRGMGVNLEVEIRGSEWVDFTAASPMWVRDEVGKKVGYIPARLVHPRRPGCFGRGIFPLGNGKCNESVLCRWLHYITVCMC